MAQSPVLPVRLVAPRPSIRAGRLVVALFLAGLLPAAEGPVPAAHLEAQALTAQAQRAAAAGDLEASRDLARRARLLAPGDPVVVAVSDALLASPAAVRPAASNPILLRQWAAAESRQARKRAEESAAAGRYEDAAEQLTVLLRALRQQGLDLDAEGAAQVAVLQDEITRYRAIQQRTQEAVGGDRRQQSVAAARAAASQQEALRERRFQERVERIRELRRRGHDDLALAEVRRLVADEPERAEARELQARILADRHEARADEDAIRAADLRAEIAQQTHEALLPGRQDGLPDYPPGWAQRRAPRGDDLLDRSREPAWMTDLKGRLAERISLTLEAVPLADAVTLVARQSGVSVVVDPALLAEDHPISIRAPSIRCDNALSWMAVQAKTTWAMVNGAVVMGAIARPEPVLAVYDVAAIVHGAQDKPPRTLTMQGSGDGAGATFTAPAVVERQITPEDFAELVRTTIRPESWDDERAGITIRGTVLFITAAPEVHQLVRELLRSQESAQGAMVRVESRWLTVEDAFFEQVGVQWTTAGATLGLNAPASGARKTWEQGDAVATVRNTLPTGTTTYATRGTTGLQLSVARVGPLQLSAILEAGQRSGQVRSVEAPTITTLNGVRGHVFYGTQTGYIADYEVSERVLDPQIRVLSAGTLLDVKPLISSDRKYVTMDLKPAVTRSSLFTDYIRSINSRRVAGDEEDEGDVIFLTTVQLPIELPNLAVRSAATTVTIPDRGSLLVGGFGKAIDERMSAGVPYLSDIPYLGRLFGTRARGSERSDLYLLTTVTIISYDELETAL